MQKGQSPVSLHTALPWWQLMGRDLLGGPHAEREVCGV